MKIFVMSIMLLGSVVAFAQKNEEEAVKKACIAQHNAWMQRDIAALKAINASVPYSSRYWATKDGWIGGVNGSDQINKTYADLINKFPEPMKATVERSNWQLKPMGENFYWATFDFVSTDQDGKEYRQKEARLLEKINGEWKMVSVITLPLAKP